MPSHGTELFVEHPSAPGNWTRGVVTAGSHGAVIARLGPTADLASMAIGDPILVYAVRAGEFSEQHAVVSGVCRTPDVGGTRAMIELTFEPLGRPAPFDRRSSQRVAAEGFGVTVDFEDEIGCAVVDFAPNGFSLQSRERHVPGAIADVTIRFGDLRLIGRAAVHSAVSLGAGRTRYGLCMLDVRDSSLRDGMERIFAELRVRAAAIATV